MESLQLGLEPAELSAGEQPKPFRGVRVIMSRPMPLPEDRIVHHRRPPALTKAHLYARAPGQDVDMSPQARRYPDHGAHDADLSVHSGISARNPIQTVKS